MIGKVLAFAAVFTGGFLIGRATAPKQEVLVDSSGDVRQVKPDIATYLDAAITAAELGTKIRPRLIEARRLLADGRISPGEVPAFITLTQRTLQTLR